MRRRQQKASWWDRFKGGLGLRLFRLTGSIAAWTWYRNYLAGTNIDYFRETGRVYDNSVVSSGANFIWKQCLYPTLIVEKREKGESGENQWAEVPDHDLAAAWESGIYYDRTVLLHGILLPFLVRGNAYLRKIRSRSNEVVGFAVLPEWQVTPKNDFGNEDGTRLITYYEFTPQGAGTQERIRPEEIVHFRWGFDPEAMALGLSPLYAALRSVYGENQASTLTAALLKNAGITGVVYSPKEGASVSMPEDPDERSEFLRALQYKTTSDDAGRPILLDFPADVHTVGFSPDQLVLDKTRAIEVSRICSALGIDPMVLGLPADNKTYANYGEAIEATFENTIEPILQVLAAQLTAQCLRTDFGADMSLRVGWDKSEVPAKQEDQDKLFTRVGGAYRQNDLITKNEARKMIGLGKVEGGDTFYSDAAFDKASQLRPLVPNDGKAKALARRWREEEGGGGIDSDEPVEI